MAKPYTGWILGQLSVLERQQYVAKDTAPALFPAEVFDFFGAWAPRR
jgi:hypothetical protein